MVQVRVFISHGITFFVNKYNLFVTLPPFFPTKNGRGVWGERERGNK
jgi:hypothetical protein